MELFDIDLDVARKLGNTKAKKYCVLPIKIEGDKLIVFSSEEDLNNKEEVEFLFNKKTEVINMKEEDIKDLIFKVFLGESEKLLEAILYKAIIERASDIHFEPQREDIFIRIRIDGLLVPFTKIKN